MDSPVRAFGFQNTPPFARNVAPVDLTSASGYALSGLKAFHKINALTLAPVPVWQTIALSSYTFGGVGVSDWLQARSSETGQTSVMMDNAAPNSDGTPHEWDAKLTDTDYALQPNQGFYVRLARGQVPPGVLTPPPAGSNSQPTAAPLNSQNDYAVLVVGDGKDGYQPMRLVFQRGSPAFLQQAGLNGTWPPAGVNGVYGNVPDSSSLWEGSRVVEILWLPVAECGAVVVQISGGREELIFRPAQQTNDQGNAQYGQSSVTPASAAPLVVSGGVLEYYGSGGTAGIEYGLLQFSPNGYIQSPTVDLPFVWQGNGTVLANGVADAASATGAIETTDFSGTRIQWQVQVTEAAGATGYAETSPVITSLQLEIPPTYDYTSVISSPADISQYVASLDETLSLQFVDAGVSQVPVIRVQAGLTFDNSSGGFTGFGGIHRAIRIRRWLNVQSPVTGLLEPYTAPITLLTGWTGMDDSVYKADPHRKFDLVAEDGAWPMTIQQIGYLDPLDGWCPLAAMRYIAQVSGRDDSFIADNFKTCGFGPNPYGCPHVKLPIGTGTSPKFSFSPNSTFWDAILEIASYYHAMVCVDPNNILQSAGYEQAVYNAPYVGMMSLQESGNPLLADFGSSIWRAQRIGVTTKERRTGVAFFGIDPAANMVQGTYLNADDFLGQGWTANVQGFRQPLIAVSNLFVDPVFTAYFALRALSRVTLPTVKVECDTLFQTGMFPLDNYGVPASFAGLTEPALMIAETIRSRWDATDPSAFGSTIQGRWAANLA